MSGRNLTITLACLAAAAAGFLLYNHQESAHPDAGFAWEQGCRMSYDLQLDTRTAHGSRQDELTDYQLEVTAVLNVKVLEAGKSIYVALQLNDVQAVSHHQPSAYLQHVYGLPFVLALQRNGLIREYHLPASLDEGGRKLLRQLISYFEVVLPSHERNIYVARQNDENGEYLAYYQRKGIEIVKEKKHYLTHGKVDAATLPQIRSSSFSFSPALHGCWLEMIDGRESVEVAFAFSDAAYFTTAVTALQLKKRPAPADAGDFWALTSMTEVLDRADLLLTARQIRQQTEEERRLQAILDKTPQTLAGLLERFTRGENDRRLLKYYLQNNPEAMEALRQMIVDGKVAEDVLAEVPALLGQIGSRQARKVLTRLWQDSSLPEPLRRQAVYTLTYIDHPIDETTFSALLSVLDNSVADAASDLCAMPVLVSGILVNNTSRHDADAAWRLNRQLLDKLAAAPDERQQSLLLAALGNARQTANIEVIIPYLQSESLSAREAAVHAAESYPSTEMADALVDQLHCERTGQIKIALLNSLKSQPISVAQVHSVGKELLQSADSDVRASAIEVLRTHKPLAPDIAADYIRQAYDKENSHENIKRMYKFMSE